MADYPSVLQSEQSRVTPRPTANFDIAVDGTIRGRDFVTDQPYDLEIIHERVSASDANSILSHYGSNGITTAFNFSWAQDAAMGISDDYTVRYVQMPIITPGGGVTFTVRSLMVGNKA